MKPDLTILRQQIVEIESRRPLTRKEVIHLCVRQKGLCGCLCGEELEPLEEGVVDEHVLALTLGGSNDLENRALWRKPCAVEKTKGDRTKDAKVKRLTGVTKNGPKKPIQSRGFDKTFRKKMNGTVERK